MGTFDIEYSQRLPSGRSTAAPITADVGAEGRALSGLGGAIFEIGERTLQIQERSELAELKRQHEEKWNAGYEELLKLHTPEERQKFYEGLSKDLVTYEAKSGRVQNEFDIYLKNNMPQYTRYFNDLNNKMIQRESKAKLEIRGQQLLEAGRVAEYVSLQNELLDSNVILPAEHEFYVKNAQTDSVFARARIGMDSDPAGVIQLLDSLPGLSGEQLDQKDKLIAHARTVLNWRKQELDDQQNSIILDMHVNLDKSPAEKFQLGEQYMEQLAQMDISAERMGVMTDRIEAWQQNKRFESDPVVKSSLFEQALDIGRGHVEPGEFKYRLQEAWLSGKINETDFGSLSDTASRTLKTSQAGALSDAVQATKNVLVDFSSELDFAEYLKSFKKSKDKERALQKRQLQFWWLSQYESEMQDWLRDNPNAGPMEFRQQAEKLRYAYMSWSAEELRFKLHHHQMKIKMEKPEFDINQERISGGKTYYYKGNGRWSDVK